MLPTYNPGDAVEYCGSKGWQFRQSGDELILTECPFCYKKLKFSWNNLTGAFQCFSAECGRKGNYFTLRRDMGDPVQPLKATPLPIEKPKPRATFSKFTAFEEALLNNPDAMAYLTKDRGLTIETIKKWHLGLKKEEKSEHRIEEVDGPVY